MRRLHPSFGVHAKRFCGDSRPRGKQLRKAPTRCACLHKQLRGCSPAPTAPVTSALQTTRTCGRGITVCRARDTNVPLPCTRPTVRGLTGSCSVHAPPLSGARPNVRLADPPASRGQCREQPRRHRDPRGEKRRAPHRREHEPLENENRFYPPTPIASTRIGSRSTPVSFTVSSTMVVRVDVIDGIADTCSRSTRVRSSVSRTRSLTR